MLQVRVYLRLLEDGSALVELVNRDTLIESLHQLIAHEIRQVKYPPIKLYDPEEPQYSEAPPLPTSKDIEHLKADFSKKERNRLRSVARVPRKIPIPAEAMKNDFTKDVIRSELIKLFPVCTQAEIAVVIKS